jgi:hypothetical protein
LKSSLDNANLSTVCDKRELEIPMRGPTINVFQAANSVISGWWRDRARMLRDQN